jgi:hypothetical protein
MIICSELPVGGREVMACVKVFILLAFAWKETMKISGFIDIQSKWLITSSKNFPNSCIIIGSVMYWLF